MVCVAHTTAVTSERGGGGGGNEFLEKGRLTWNFATGLLWFVTAVCYIHLRHISAGILYILFQTKLFDTAFIPPRHLPITKVLNTFAHHHIWIHIFMGYFTTGKLNSYAVLDAFCAHCYLILLGSCASWLPISILSKNQVNPICPHNVLL